MVLDKEIPPDPRVETEAKYLARAGFKVFIFSLNFGNLPEEETYQNFTIYRKSISKRLVKKISAIVNTIPLYYWILGHWVREFIERYNIEVLHLHDLYTIPIGQKATRRINIPLVVDLHENYPAAIQAYEWANTISGKILVQPDKWSDLEGRYLRSVDRVLVLSESYKTQLLQKYEALQPENLFIYPNVPDIEVLQSYPDYEVLQEFQNRFILFYFGIISERRGIHTCLKALSLLKKKMPNVLLLLIGPIDQKERDTFHKALNDETIQDSIEYHPWEDMAYIPSYIRRSDVCLSPLVKNDQHNSGIANKVFQYMAFGKPVIASDCLPQKQLVEQADCGLVFHSEDVQGFVKSVEQLYDDADRREQMGANGKKAVERRYNVDHYGKALVELYQSL